MEILNQDSKERRGFTSSGRARDKVILSLMASAMRAERVLMIEVA